MYGDWEDGLPHGRVVHRSKDLIIFSNHSKGNPVGKVLAVNDSIQHLSVIWGDGHPLSPPEIIKIT